MRRTRWEQTKEDIFHSTSLFCTINDFSGKTKTFTIPSFASCDIQLNEEISVSLGLESDLKYSRSSYKHSHFCWVFELISQSFYETFMLKIFTAHCVPSVSTNAPNQLSCAKNCYNLNYLVKFQQWNRKASSVPYFTMTLLCILQIAWWNILLL